MTADKIDGLKDTGRCAGYFEAVQMLARMLCPSKTNPGCTLSPSTEECLFQFALNLWGVPGHYLQMMENGWLKDRFLFYCCVATGVAVEATGYSIVGESVLRLNFFLFIFL